MARKAPRRKKPKQTLLLPMNDENLETLKKVLLDIYHRLNSVHDHLVVVGLTLTDSMLEHNAEIGRVLLRGATNPLSRQLDELRFVIRQLGGADMFSEDQPDDAERTKFGELE